MLNETIMSVPDSLEWIKDNSYSGEVLPRIRNKKLPIKNIRVNLEVFQCRSIDNFGESQRLSANHIKELRERLRTEELDAITIYNVGGNYYVIDGHHRLEAYRQEGIRQIPVTEFKGEAKEALFYGIKENSKNKISLTKEQRSELCWRFIVEDGSMSKLNTATAFSVSERLVAYMRSRRKELGGDALELQWWEARKTEGIDEDRDTTSKEEYLSKKIYQLLGAELLRDTRVVAKAIALLGSYRFDGLLQSMMNEYDEINKGELDCLKRRGDELYGNEINYLSKILSGLTKSRVIKPKVVEHEVGDYSLPF